MTIHEGAWPDTITDPKVKQLLENYLRFSNASNPHHPDQASEEKFASLFTTHGVYQLAQKKAKGQKGE
jgi:hypothetical protein